MDLAHCSLSIKKYVGKINSVWLPLHIAEEEEQGLISCASVFLKVDNCSDVFFFY